MMKRIFLKAMNSLLLFFSVVTVGNAVADKKANVKQNKEANKFEIRYETPKQRKIKKLREGMYDLVKEVQEKEKEKKKIEKKKIIEKNKNEIKEMDYLKFEIECLKSKIIDLNLEIKKEIEKDKKNLASSLNGSTNDYFIIYAPDSVFKNQFKEIIKEKGLSDIGRDNFTFLSSNDKEKQLYNLEKVLNNKKEKLYNLESNLKEKIQKMNQKIDNEISNKLYELQAQYLKNLKDIRKNKYKKDELILNIDAKSDKENLDEMKKKIINKYRYADIPAICYDKECFDFTRDVISNENILEEIQILSEGLYKEILAFCMILNDMSFRNQITFYENIVDEGREAMPVNDIADVFKYVFTNIYEDLKFYYKWARLGECVDVIEKKLILYNMKNKDKHKLKQALREELINYVPKEKNFLDVKYRIINIIKNKMREIKLELETKTEVHNFYLDILKILSDRLERIQNVNFRDVEDVIKNLKVEKFLNQEK